jgi:hypothetical protein
MPRNARLSPKERRQRAAAKGLPVRRNRKALTVHQEHVLLFKFLVGLVLLFPAAVTTQGFFELLVDSASDHRFWHTPTLQAFFAGTIAWLLWFFFARAPIRAYVFGHELTHAIFVRLSGGEVTGWNVTHEGGYIIADRTNTAISLSPYLIPIYSILVMIVAAALSPFVRFDLIVTPHPLPPFSLLDVFVFLIGFTWCFHLTFTIRMIHADQPDLHQNGTFFSLILIYFVNLLIISTFIVLISPELSPIGFINAWFDRAYSWYRAGISLFSR